MTGTHTYDVFDCHEHVGGVFGVPGLRHTDSSAESLHADVTTRLDTMDRLGIRQAAVMPGHSYPKPNGLADTRAINDRLAAYRRAAPDRFPVVIGTVEPRYGADAVGEVERMHGELGFQGVSWHHRQQGMPMDHPVMQAILDRMQTLKMLPMIHCMVDADFEELWRLRRLAEMFPALPFLCLDSMTHAEQFEEALAVGERAGNVYFDTTSSVMGPAGIARFVETLGSARLLFGTNLYSRQTPTQLEELESVLAAEISDDAKRMILCGNARRLFGLSAG